MQSKTETRSKRFYWKHRDQNLAKSKEYHKKWYADPENRKKRVEQSRKHYWEHLDQVLRYKKEYVKGFSEERKSRNREDSRNRAREQREELKKIIGSKCFICGIEKFIHFHEIHGKEHRISYYYYIKHPKDFVPLCYHCHRAFHKFMKDKERYEALAELSSKA